MLIYGIACAQTVADPKPPLRNPSEFQNPLTTDRWRMRVYPAYISVIGIYYVFSLVKEERYGCRQYG